MDNYAYSEYKHSLTFRVQRYVAITTKPVHRLQIRPVVPTRGHPLPFPKLHPGPSSSVGMQRGTDIQTHTETHTDGRDHYTFRVVYDLREK